MATEVPKPKGMNGFDWDAANAAYRAGFRGSALATSVAVAIAESGRYQYAHNTNSDGSHDRGPWQINDKAHPDVSDQEAYGFDTAAVAAFKISSGGHNWSPWVAYKTRAYIPFMGSGVAAANAATKVHGTSPSPGSGGQPGSSEGVDSGFLGTGVGHPSKTLKHTWDALTAPAHLAEAVYSFFFEDNGALRIIYIIVGGVLLFMALRIFARELGAGDAQLGAAQSAGIGKVGSGAKSAGKALVKVAK